MWPFTKREVKSVKLNWRDEARASLKTFRDIGQTFTYLGKTCVVTRHDQFRPRFGAVPMLVCDYADDHGVIRQITFSASELPALVVQQADSKGDL